MQIQLQQKFDFSATLAKLSKIGDYFEIDKNEVNVSTVRSAAARYGVANGIKLSVTEEGSILKVERK